MTDETPKDNERLLIIGIYIDKHGRTFIEGNFEDEVASYGLLEKARQVVQRYHTPSVVKPASFLQDMRKNGMGK